MKTLFLFTIFLLTCGSYAGEVMNDAKEIMHLLQMTINNMDQLSTCYATAHQANYTIQQKRRCLAVVSKMSLAGQTSSQQSGNRHRCRPFHRWQC